MNGDENPPTHKPFIHGGAPETLHQTSSTHHQLRQKRRCFVYNDAGKSFGAA